MKLDFSLATKVKKRLGKAKKKIQKPYSKKQSVKKKKR